ncbi:MAG: DUF2231 domain-containing protein [Trichodesmium sp. St15_bin1_1]|nr:DUF2231 domain-containing protein [Trichodesmium sp. MAG_R02]MDE5074917.1 DUF2231 domain-containing protein [Trichodesmium sp. St5_bin2_1]MDE5084899.1 DUF2231 domain-containing protein [Trichodesmium sp. St18_bin1]MDE5085764.1 DUF2231 domain-containing protein [Trichodesmium sp. St16_bin2-tuft]MDE5109854.1 DUF2231 domain-containing protein [Trichodesmium sp. St7_bin2_1]MDE5114498.1 DUF2231 domain-containing protein [Trichodesmium sp. St15_bin1_1]MDE5118535.1 DUF2231 domain-containing prote
MWEYLPPLNEHNLPYPDTIHPIVVHFVIGMVLFAFLCDIIGYFTRNSRLYEVSWWNMFFATISIFIAIIFGQFEAGLAQPYKAVEPILNLHTLIGWSLSGIIAAITAWRYVIRSNNAEKLPMPYLGLGLLLVGIVCFQVYLGDELVWVYGLHTVPVVEAIKEGILQ